MFKLFGPMEEEDLAAMIGVAMQHSKTGLIDFCTFESLMKEDDE